MNLLFSHRRIAGLLAVVPANERSFVDEMANFNFPPARSLKLRQVMGYDKRRLVHDGVCSSDLACFGMEHLFATGKLSRQECDALIVVTQSPDYFLPRHQQRDPGPARSEARHVLPGHQPGLRRLSHRPV